MTELGLGHLGAEGIKGTRSLKLEAEREGEVILVLSPQLLRNSGRGP